MKKIINLVFVLILAFGVVLYSICSIFEAVSLIIMSGLSINLLNKNKEKLWKTDFIFASIAAIL